MAWRLIDEDRDQMKCCFIPFLTATHESISVTYIETKSIFKIFKMWNEKIMWWQESAYQRHFWNLIYYAFQSSWVLQHAHALMDHFAIARHHMTTSQLASCTGGQWIFLYNLHLFYINTDQVVSNIFCIKKRGQPGWVNLNLWKGAWSNPCGQEPLASWKVLIVPIIRYMY